VGATGQFDVDLVDFRLQSVFGLFFGDGPSRMPIRMPRCRLSMKNRPSVPIVMPGVRVVAMCSS